MIFGESLFIYVQQKKKNNNKNNRKSELGVIKIFTCMASDT